MARETTPSFILELLMNTSPQVRSTIEKGLETNRVIYNACLGELLKREKQFKQTKAYKRLRKKLRAISKQYSFHKEKRDKEKTKFFAAEKKTAIKELLSLQEAFGLTEYSIHSFVNRIRSHFQNRVNSNEAQKTATRAWNTFLRKVKGEAKKVVFKKKDEFFSFEGKSNGTGWRFLDNQIVYQNFKVSLVIHPKDVYAQEVLCYLNSQQSFTYTTATGEVKEAVYKVKYVRIVKKEIRGKNYYYAQLVCAGYPPVKKNKDGSEKYPLGTGCVGTDIGTSSVALSGEKQVGLFTLGEGIKRIDGVQRTIRLLQRKMDRSKRAMNPDYYRPNGTVKPGKKEWAYSNRYKKWKMQLKELHRKQAVYRKLSHHELSNLLKTWGDEFYIEEMNFRGLQKRAKETKISEKTGKFQKKKRFGKSIAHRAPAMFVSILKQKVETSGGSFDEVNTRTFKASQYDHKSNAYKKKELTERWHQFEDGERVQRDLYSAFLLQHAKKNKKTTDQNRCLLTFSSFKTLHDQEIKRLENEEIMVLNSGIRLKMKKTTEVVE